MQAAYFCIACW